MFFEDYAFINSPVSEAPVAKVKKVRTHYDNLKVSRTASQIEIRQAYRRLVSLNHPDRNNSQFAVNATQCINKAYKILSNEASRADHDEWIKQEEKPPASAFRSAPKPHPAPSQKQTKYARDQEGWSPDHAEAFKQFVQDLRVKYNAQFYGISTDILYNLFLEDLKSKAFNKHLREDARKAVVLAICSALCVLLVTAYVCYLILR